MFLIIFFAVTSLLLATLVLSFWLKRDKMAEWSLWLLFVSVLYLSAAMLVLACLLKLQRI